MQHHRGGIPPAPPMQHQNGQIPSFVQRMDNDTFGFKNNFHDSREKAEIDQLDMIYDINKRSRSHSRERENYAESVWDRSEVEGPPSNDEMYRSNIRDKNRKDEMSQIEREMESLKVYQPKNSDKSRHSSASDQATFKNHMYSQKEREKKKSFSVAQLTQDEDEENFDNLKLKTIPKPVLGPPMLKAPAACLTYGIRVPWKLRVKKEVFTPNETIDSTVALNFIFTQIIDDVMGGSVRISQQEKMQALNFLKSHNIDPERMNDQIRSFTKRQFIEIARSWPLYFSRFYAVNGFSPQSPDVSILAIHHTGLYLAHKENETLIVSKSIRFAELMSAVSFFFLLFVLKL